MNGKSKCNGHCKSCRCIGVCPSDIIHCDACECEIGPGEEIEIEMEIVEHERHTRKQFSYAGNATNNFIYRIIRKI